MESEVCEGGEVDFQCQHFICTPSQPWGTCCHGNATDSDNHHHRQHHHGNFVLHFSNIYSTCLFRQELCECQGDRLGFSGTNNKVRAVCVCLCVH